MKITIELDKEELEKIKGVEVLKELLEFLKSLKETPVVIPYPYQPIPIMPVPPPYYPFITLPTSTINE
ncbi:MAG: hypothetical protein QXL94_02240 [Candidatus Parvarchaeum sp.]